MAVILIVSALVILLMILIFDKNIIRFIASNYVVPERYETQVVHKPIVWKSISCSALSRRSLYNPDLWYDAKTQRWHVLCRYTRGHRAMQYISSYIKEEEEIPNHRLTMLLYTLDKDFHEIDCLPVYVNDEPLKGFSSDNMLYWNGEDPRLFFDESVGKFMVQATLHNANRKTYLGHGVLVGHGDYSVWEVKRICGILGEEIVSHKNWSYIRENLYLTHCYPNWQIVKMNTAGGCTIVQRTPTILKNEVRCTTKFISYGDRTYLTLLHTFKPYRTVFCEVDKQTLRPLRYSQPIRFFEQVNYVEFPSGLFVQGEYVYVGLGVNDCDAYIIRIEKNHVDKLLQ